MSLLDDIANGFRQMFGGGNNNNRRPQAQPKPYAPQYDLNKPFDTNFNPSRDFSNPYQMNNDEEERREQERKRREEDERRRQAEEDRRREAERKKQEAERLKQTTQKKPGFFDYLNPFGEHGLFGTKQQQNFKNTIKPINDTLQAYEKTIDKSDKQAGFQWNDIGDYLRFAAKLPTGMVSGIANAPEKIGQAISGVRNNDKGEVEHLNLLQRGATALDAGIDIGGLGFGGSGTLLRSLGKEVAEETAKKGIKQTIKSIAKDALQEGIEEGTQTFLGDLSDDGKLNANLNQYVQSVALGALGGGLMSGAGKSISSAKQAYLQSPQAKLDNQVAQRMATDPEFAEAVAKRKQEIKQAMLEAREEATQEQVVKKNLAQTVTDAYHDGKLLIPRTELTPNAGRNARMRQAIDNAPISEPFNYGRVSKDTLAQHNDIQAQTGQDFVKNRDVTVYPNAHNAHVEKRINQEGVSPEDYIKIAEKAIYGKNKQLLPSPNETGIQNVMYANTDNPSGRVMMGNFNDGLSLKSVQQINNKRLEADIKKAQAKLGTPLVDDGSQAVSRAVSSLDSTKGMNPIGNPLGTRDINISQTDEKVNPVEYNELHEAEYQPDQASGSVLDRRQRFDAIATEVDGQVQASERAWRDNRGTEVGTNDEVAREKIAQLLKDYRNPDRELTHFFYVKDGVIVGHNVTTLNDPISSSVGAKEAMWGINNRMERLGADKFYLAHNHPSGNLSASSGDRHVTQIIQKQLGDKFGGHIITDHDGILTSKDGYFDKTNLDLGEQYVKDGVQITTEDKALELAKEHFDPKVNHDKIGLFMLDVLYRPIGYEKFRPRMKDGKVDIEATNNTIKQMATKHNGIVTLVAAGDDFKHIDNRTGIHGIIGDQLMLPTDSGDFRSLNNFEGGDAKSQSARLRKYLARNGKNSFLHDGASDIKQASDFYYNDHQSAAQLRQNLIDQLWEANKKGQGVDHIFHEAENALDDTYMVRVSNNSPFYSGYFEANGKKPSKAGITAIVDEMLGIENDYPTPTMTHQMWDAIAYEYGNLEGIADAYRRLSEKSSIDTNDSWTPSEYDLALEDLMARSTDLKYLEGKEYDELYRQLEKEKADLDKKYGVNQVAHQPKVDYRKRYAKEKQMLENIIAESNSIKQELSQDPTPIKQVIDQKQDEFKNVPLENKNHAYTKGNLYQQTAIGSAEDVVRGGGGENGRRFIFGDWELHQHTRKKDGKIFTQAERRYINPKTGEVGKWRPYSRAAYLWHTQSDKIDQANRDQLIQQALEAAKQDGEVREFVAKIDETTGGTKVEQLTGEKTIDGGLVRDPESGVVEGNYIQVTPFGVINQVAGKLHLTELDQIIANNSDKKSKPGIFDTYMRTVEKTAANDQARQTQQNLYYKKTKAYAGFVKNKEEVLEAHAEQADILESYRPKAVKAKDFWEDVGRYTEKTFPAVEGKNQQEAFAKKYGDEAAQAVEKYSQYMRQQYDSLINQANTVRRMYGKDEIPHRKNYMPHMTKDGGLLGMMPAEIAANLRGEMEATGRGEIPANIAGLSETFKPTKKYNKHEMQRKRKDANDYELDPRKVFEKYTDLVLYNAHMKPVIAEGRQLETAMRVAEHELAKEVLDPLSALKQGEAKVSSRQTIAIMDFVNAMAGKSNALDRAFIDRAAGNMKIIRKLENINGANKIMGNISSTLAQALNLPSTIRDNGVKNTAKAVLNAFNSETKAAMSKSAFLTERYADGGENFSKTNWQKFSGGVSKATGMDLVEGAFIRLAWGANYQRLKSQGLKGFELIKQTDLATERAVGGRGVGAMPQAYQSALGKIFLQFTYETNETFKNNMAHVKGVVKGLKSGDYKKAGSMAVRGAEAMVTAMVLNAIYKQITGNEPLPDLLGAAIKTGANASKDDEDETKENVVRNAVGNIGTEFIKSNPVASAAVNMWPKSGRQQIFGHDSDFGRFDGATGVAQTAFNAVGGALNLAAGESGKAAQNLAQLVPMGSQIRKTIGGGTDLLKGAVTKKDKNGDEQVVYEVDNKNPINIVKGLVFGKNALNETQAHYQAKDGQKTGGKVVSANSNLLKSVEKQYGKDSWQYIGLKEAMARRKSNKENAQYKTSVVGVADEMRIKLAKGDLIQDKPEEGGLLRTRDGNVAKEFYKKLAKAEGNPDVFKEYINSDEGMKFEYLEAQRQYDQAMKEGSLSKKEQIKKRQELAKMRVQSNWRKEYRDAYSLTNSYQDVQSIYALYGDAKNEARQKLNKINDAMFKAKLIDQKTYDKRHENINEIDKPKRGRGGRRSTSDSFTVPKLPGYRITGAPDFQRTTKKGKGIVKGLKLAKAGGVDVSPLPRVRITRR